MTLLLDDQDELGIGVRVIRALGDAIRGFLGRRDRIGGVGGQGIGIQHGGGTDDDLLT